MLCCIKNLLYGLLGTVGCLLSALIISEQFRKLIFAKIFTSKLFNNWIKGLFMEHRPIFLKDFIGLKSNDANEKLKVLEVGVGDGANFDHYPDNCSLTVLDCNEHFRNAFLENIKKYPKIELNKCYVGTVEDMHQLNDNSFDVVLITHVFCSVPDVPKSLAEVKRVLKMGGRYIFVEHVGYKDKSNNYCWNMVQLILQPLWKILMGGCHLNRQTWSHIQNANFNSIKLNFTYPENLPGIIRPHIYGCAVK